MCSGLQNFFVNRKKNLLLYCLSFLTVLILMWTFFALFSYAPFGENSLAWNDADIQYLDFFSYYKDVLEGKNNIGYTFTKELGGTSIALFSYYLASPFNLLVLFFPKTQLNIFFNLLVSIKLSTAALTSTFFFRKRFSEKLHSKYCVILGIEYALMQYNVAQCSNIMWLEGVYMLPLILLGVYYLIKKHNIYLLSISVGFAIIFNWYSAGIDCLFAIIWFFFELFLNYSQNKAIKRKLIAVFFDLVRFGCSMAIGVLMSAVLFLPTISAMKNSAEGVFDWALVKNEFIGDIVSVIQNYSLSAVSSKGNVALFCGSVGLLGCLCFFFSKRIDGKKKVFVGIMLLISLLCFYWTPMVLLFSLFKSVESYWYRYSYTAIFLILFIAASYYQKSEHNLNDISFLPVRCAATFSALLLILNYVHPLWEIKYVYATVILMLLISVLIAEKNIGMLKPIYISFALVAMSCFELFVNVYLLAERYHTNSADTFTTYMEDANKQINAIGKIDNTNYRISQTTTRKVEPDGITAYYNGAMALNYKSITEYSSAPDSMQMEFLSRLGYRCEGDNMQIVNTSIVGVDTLLGVKYILSPYEIRGLIPLKNLGVYNEKTVYENPYALPMTFLYRASEMEEKQYINSFEYQNMLYSQLYGKKAEIYQKLEFERQEKNNTVIYTIKVPEGNYVLYGNLPWNSEMYANININGNSDFGYAKWLSPSVFYIPTDDATEEVVITLTAEKIDLYDEQFYALDLDMLGKVAASISQRKVNSLNMENGYVTCYVEADEGDSLFLSVPYHSGWTILRNGKEVEPELFGECLITIPLVDGPNEIEMVYRVPMLREGVILTGFVSIILLGYFCFYKKEISSKKILKE